MKPQFKPTPDMIQAASTVFLAIAYTETIRPTIEAIQSKLLKELSFKPSEKWVKMGINDLPERITENKNAYLLNDEDAKKYFSLLDEEVKKAGFNVKTGYCPLLIAEDMERKAKRLLIDTMEPITGFNTDKILCTGLDNYKKMVELTLALLAPYCKESKEIKEHIN